MLMAITTTLPSLAINQLGAGQSAKDLGTAGYVLRSGGTSGNITWAPVDEDLVDYSEIHTNSATITFSTDNGTTIAGSISTGNAWTIGLAGSGSNHVMHGSQLDFIEAGVGSFVIARGSDSASLNINGGNNGTGGEIRMYGGNHASRAAKIEFYQVNTKVGEVTGTGI